ncbi:hypothetical protein [Vibrio cyclitrophicus]|uniref:hypothetical protein n=1 Tax=Vibrio cyclitrophicus TaxID=47951 RepID=UPI00399A8178
MSYDKFTAGKIIIYFTIPPIISLFTLSLGQDKIDLYVFHRIAHAYRNFGDLILATFIPLLTLIFTYVGYIFAVKVNTKNSFLKRVLYPIVRCIDDKKLFKNSSLLYFFALIIFFVLLTKIGGLSAYWEDVNSRVENLGGLGYLNKGYVFVLIFSSNLLCIYFFGKGKQLLPTLLIVFSCVCLSLLGSRSTTLSFLISLIISYNFFVKPIKKLVSFNTILIVLTMLVFILGVVKLRENGAIEKYSSDPVQLAVDMQDSFERHVIMRFSRVERDIIIFSYFSEHDLWYGKSYTSLFTAPIPRAFYSEKPPIDTGMYLVKIAQGGIVNFPERMDSLPSYSWPTGNSEAYMNFHFPGLIIAMLISGFVFGKIYLLIFEFNYRPYFIVFYSMLCFGGAPNMSVMGIVNLLTYFAFFLITLVILNTLSIRIRR